MLLEDFSRWIRCLKCLVNFPSRRCFLPFSVFFFVLFIPISVYFIWDVVCRRCAA